MLDFVHVIGLLSQFKFVYECESGTLEFLMFFFIVMSYSLFALLVNFIDDNVLPVSLRYETFYSWSLTNKLYLIHIAHQMHRDLLEVFCNWHFPH